MAELTDVLGSIFRGIAGSRVTSDVFSRDVSLEYEQDPILSAFPVPRVEIKEASLQLKFAINTVERAAVDIEKITKQAVSGHAKQLADEVYAEYLANITLTDDDDERSDDRDEDSDDDDERSDDRDKKQSNLKEKRAELKKNLPGLIEQVILSPRNQRDLEAARRNQPQALARKLGNMLGKTLLDDAALKKVLIREKRVGEIRKDLEARASKTMRALASDLIAASAAADREALSVDVAVAKKDLLDLPEALLSQISVVTEIRNYEWTEVGEVDDQPVRRLRPE